MSDWETGKPTNGADGLTVTADTGDSDSTASVSSDDLFGVNGNIGGLRFRPAS